MSRAAGEAGLVGPRGERAWGVALGGKEEAGAGGAGLAGGAGSPGVGLLQRKVRGSKSSPRSPSRQRGGLKSSSSPSSSQAEVRCEGEPESAPSPAVEDSEEEEEDDSEEDSVDSDDDRLSQEPAGAGPTGKASLLEWGRRSLCSRWRPGRAVRGAGGVRGQGSELPTQITSVRTGHTPQVSRGNNTQTHPCLGSRWLGIQGERCRLTGDRGHHGKSMKRITLFQRQEQSLTTPLATSSRPTGSQTRWLGGQPGETTSGNYLGLVLYSWMWAYCTVCASTLGRACQSPQIHQGGMDKYPLP